MIDELNNIPDITFIDDITIEDVQNQMITDFQAKYEEITGTPISLAKADPYRLILYACSLQQFQMLTYLDEMGKQNLLKYAVSAFLDQIGAIRGVKRLEGSKAITTIRFELEEARESATSIPLGTRVAAEDYYFETTEYAEIAAGETYADVPAECTEIGEETNGLMPGEVNTIVDSVPFIGSASNITTTNSGSDVESDDNLTDRIYLAPSGYSVAGPEDAYKYFVKACNSGISDVSVTSPEKVKVDIRFVMKDGSLPSEELIADVLEYISAKDKRPLTDQVSVSTPETTEYNINLTYWVGESKKSTANSIQEAVTNAVEEYKAWQNSSIGRDINPSELIYKVKAAGAKRVEVTEPVFTIVDDTHIAQSASVSVTYGGVESD